MLINLAWRAKYPNAIAIALPIINSDHSPTHIQVHPIVRTPRDFKYVAYWEEDDECKDIILEGWDSGFLLRETLNGRTFLAKLDHARFPFKTRERLNSGEQTRKFGV